jgi:DNA-directed RNA polymerase specialized sigma24 family protein
VTGFSSRRGRRCGVGEDDRKILAHHAAEIARFYTVHAGWLFGYARLRVEGDREHAADLVQDTFEAATLAWETVRKLAPAQHRVWLRTTLSHKVSSHVRRRMALRRRQPALHDRYQAPNPIPSGRRCLRSRLNGP